MYACARSATKRAEQPIAAFAPLCDSLEISGACQGAGRCTLVTDRDVSSRSCPRTFAFSLRPPPGASPRFVLRLEAADPKAREVLWSVLEAKVDLPCPSEKDLRIEVLALLKEVIAPWIERGVDDVGPRKTGLLCHDIDAVRGTVLSTYPGGFHPLWEQIAQALEVEEVPEWRAAYERFLGDWLELCFDPETSLRARGTARRTSRSPTVPPATSRCPSDS
jgi:hypothetical protein